MKVLSTLKAVELGYSSDKRKRKRQHRQAAKRLRNEGGGIMRAVAAWHAHQARYL